MRKTWSLLVLGVLAVGCGGGGGDGGGGEVPEAVIGESLDGLDGRALPPLIVTMQRLPDAVQVDDVVRFRLTATLRSPQPTSSVSIRLQNPPPGCTCPVVTANAATASCEGRWVVASPSVGFVRLAFRLATSAGVFRRTFDVRVDGSSVGNGVLVGDVTGDGRLDVVSLASASGAADAGALFVFAGASNPVAAPTATLRDPSGSAADALGGMAAPNVHLVDVTGDGILDVVAAVPFSDRGAVDAGAILVWAGGATLAGAPLPTCVLVSSTPTPTAMLGWADAFVLEGDGSLRGGGKPSMTFVDVTGDRVRDVIVAAPNEDGAVTDAGAVYVFEGGASLTTVPLGGTRTERARLVPPAGSGAALLGSGQQPVRVGDLTGDGFLDVIVSTSVVPLERLYVFAGGPALGGTQTPLASLRVGSPAATQPSQFVGRHRFAEIGDVNGDGTDDVVACSEELTVNSVPLPGVGCVWLGGATFSGDRAPDAVLGAGSFGDRQGQSGLRLRDVTGDGTLDVLIAAPGAGGGTGEIRLWKGGPLGSSTPAPAFLRQAAPAAAGSLGATGGRLTEPFTFGDVTGDGVEDLVVPAFSATYGGGTGAGQGVVFRGGADMAVAPGTAVAPLSTLRGDAISGLARGDVSGSGVHLEDLDRDGALDVVIASLAGGSANARIECWRGGAAALQPIDAPDRVFTLPLSLSSGTPVTLCDVTGDGRPDVLVRTGPATATSPAVHVLEGASLFAGGLQPLALATGDTETPAQRKGIHGLFVPVLAGDVTGDGRLDVVGPNLQADVGGASSGCVYLWNAALLGPGTANPSGLPTLRIRGHAPAGRRYPDGVRGSQGVVLADLTGDGVLEVLVGDPIANAGDGEIGWVRSQPALPTGSPTGTTAYFVGPADADGLTR